MTVSSRRRVMTLETLSPSASCPFLETMIVIGEKAVSVRWMGFQVEFSALLRSSQILVLDPQLLVQASVVQMADVFCPLRP